MENETLEEEINDSDSEPVDNIEIDEEDDKQNVDDGSVEEDQKSDIPEEVTPQGKVFFIKWKLLILLGSVLAVTGLGIKFAPDLLKMNGQGNLLEINKDNENLTEEELSPFFIPSEEGSLKGAIRIDLSVIWNGLAAVRFEKKGLQIRSDLYIKLTDIARGNDDLNSMIPFLENKIGSVFRESLGVRNLAIKIKEIRYF